MIHAGANLIDGVPVEVIRKRIRCINIRVKADGGVVLSIPKWWATLRQGEAFLREKWKWIAKARAEILAWPTVLRTPVTDEEIAPASCRSCTSDGSRPYLRVAVIAGATATSRTSVPTESHQQECRARWRGGCQSIETSCPIH